MNSSAPPGPLTNNTISVVDGLGEIAIDAQLSDVLTATSTGVPQIGIDLDASTPTPSYYAQNQATTSTAMTATLRNPPMLGLWYVQAVEKVSSATTPNPTFGGPDQQQLSVNVDD
jgi:hypothetical protein